MNSVTNRSLLIFMTSMVVAQSGNDQTKIHIEAPVHVATGSIFDGKTCTRFFGPELVECMRCLPPEQLKSNFLQLNPRAAAYVLKELEPSEQYELAQACTDQEWIDWWNSLPPNLQARIPKTRLVQQQDACYQAGRRKMYLERTGDLIAAVLLWGLKLLIASR